VDQPQPPNILFVFADQLRGSDFGAAGNPDVATPHLDQLAREGMRLTHAYANTPVCTPNRATMLTGLYPTHHRVIANDLPLPEDCPSIATLLAEAGYRTGYIGKWHLDGVPRSRFTPPGPRRHGFEDWAVYNCSHSYFDARYYRDTDEPIEIDGYEPITQTDLACDFVADADERPFCLFLSWGPPHDPYDQVPASYRARYDPESLQLRANVRDLDEDSTFLARNLSPRETLANYYAAITALDDQLGRLLATLKASGKAGDTIVIFTSDHGDMLFSHGRMKKQLPFEESINVPLVVRWPDRIAAGRVDDLMISTVDLTPTLLGLVGVPVTVPMDGTDLSATLRGGDGPRPGAVFLLELLMVDEAISQGVTEWRGLRTERFTYAVRAGGVPWVLYDNEADPWQLRNLVADPAYLGLRQQLADELSRWRQRVDDRHVDGADWVADLGLTELWQARQDMAKAFYTRPMTSPDGNASGDGRAAEVAVKGGRAHLDR